MRAAADPATEALLRAARGDVAAFEVVYDATCAPVFGVVRRVLRDPARAEEVTQEVYVEVWRQAARFDPARGSARTWILTLAHRRAVDRVRSEQRARDRDAHDAAVARPAPDGPDDVVIGRSERTRVVEALDRLTPVQRQAIELAYFGGLTHREVAAELGQPLGTVKTRIRDGLLRLRDELGASP